MANTNLVVDRVTNHAMMILHQKLNFVGKINRQYDDSYKTGMGAKGGSTLRIKLPNQFTVRTGLTLNTQDVTQTSVTMTTATVKGVDMNFNMQELTQDISLFQKNYVEPAMAVLAANIESDVMSVYKDVYQEISDVGASMTLADALNMSKYLTDSLTPSGDRCLNLDTQSNVDLVSALSGLFNPAANLSENFKEGMVANEFVGFSQVYQNTLWPTHTTGTDDGTGDYLTNDATAQTGSSITVNTGTGTFKKGDIIYIDGVYSVHPETKQSTGLHQPFVITSDVSANATSLPISPEIIASGARQNVSNGAANDKAIHKVESDNRGTLTSATDIGASADYRVCMGFHRDAFAFATADMEMPEGVHFAGRKVHDGISMSVIRDYDINNHQMPMRIDVLYGYKTLRPELAVRGGFN